MLLIEAFNPVQKGQIPLSERHCHIWNICHSLLEEICPQISAGKKFGPCLLDTWSQTNLEMSVSNFSIDAIQQNIICKKWKWNATIQTIQHSTKPKALKTLDVGNFLTVWTAESLYLIYLFVFVLFFLLLFLIIYHLFTS